MRDYPLSLSQPAKSFKSFYGGVFFYCKLYVAPIEKTLPHTRFSAILPAGHQADCFFLITLEASIEI